MPFLLLPSAAPAQVVARCRRSGQWSTSAGADETELIRQLLACPAVDTPRGSRHAAQTVDSPFDQFLVTAEAVAAARPEVDLEMAREVFQEAATLLHHGLALDGLDGHDASVVLAGLCVDLVTEDPGAAVRARSQATSEAPGDLHDPEGVSAAYLIAVALFQL